MEPEPLAKFHARIDPRGRIVLPKTVRDIFEIEAGDFVTLLVRKIKLNKDAKEIHVYASFKFSGRVNDKGAVVIPKHLRDKYMIKHGELVEILLLDHGKPEDNRVHTTYTYIFHV